MSDRVNIRNFSVLAYAQGFTLWHYRLEEQALESALSPGFLNDCTDMLKTGDIVLFSGVSGATISLVRKEETTIILEKFL